MCFSSALDEEDPLSHEIYRYEVDFKAELVAKATLGGGAEPEVVAVMKEAFESAPENARCFETGYALSLLPAFHVGSHP